MPATPIRFPTTVGVRLPEVDAERLRQLAAADDRPPSALARRIILDGLSRYEEQQPAAPA